MFFIDCGLVILGLVKEYMIFMCFKNFVYFFGFWLDFFVGDLVWEVIVVVVVGLVRLGIIVEL